MAGLEEDPKLKAIVIEGLSFNSFSSEKDKINGNFWHLRCRLARRFPGVLIGIVPVAEWRSSCLNKQEQKEAKLKDKKLGLKQACVDKLPKEVAERFERYLKDAKQNLKGLYDLTDSYFLGIYRLSLGL